jgi:hypothetical protein
MEKAKEEAKLMTIDLKERMGRPSRIDLGHGPAFGRF